MSTALAGAAVIALAVAALAATPAALWLRLRGGRRDAGALVLVVFLAAQAARLGSIAAGEAGAALERPWVGVPAWLGWMLGASGLAALAAIPRQEGAADRAAALAFGLFGLGHLLRELARVVAPAVA